MGEELPDAEDAKVTQRTQKKKKTENKKFKPKNDIEISERIKFLKIWFSFGISFLRPLRNFCVLCVRKSVFKSLSFSLPQK
jgi:hypothetical protein